VYNKLHILVGEPHPFVASALQHLMDDIEAIIEIQNAQRDHG
jgi:hypothetical protein